MPLTSVGKAAAVVEAKKTSRDARVGQEQARQYAERLKRVHEVGRGYHRVRVELRDGRVIEPAIVLNSEVLEVADITAAFDPRDIERIALAPAPPR